MRGSVVRVVVALTVLGRRTTAIVMAMHHTAAAHATHGLAPRHQADDSNARDHQFGSLGTNVFGTGLVHVNLFHNSSPKFNTLGL